MTKRIADEQPKYSVLHPQDDESSHTGSALFIQPKPFHNNLVQGYYVVLTAREAYIWRRLGGPTAVRDMLTPLGICAQCDEEHTDPTSYQGWFCTYCQQTLTNLGMLPPKLT